MMPSNRPTQPPRIADTTTTGFLGGLGASLGAALGVLTVVAIICGLCGGCALVSLILTGNVHVGIR